MYLHLCNANETRLVAVTITVSNELGDIAAGNSTQNNFEIASARLRTFLANRINFSVVGNCRWFYLTPCDDLEDAPVKG